MEIHFKTQYMAIRTTRERNEGCLILGNIGSNGRTRSVPGGGGVVRVALDLLSWVTQGSSLLKTSTTRMVVAISQAVSTTTAWPASLATLPTPWSPQ